MASKTATQKATRIENLAQVQRALRKVCPDAHKGLKAASHDIAQQVVSVAKGQAGSRRQSARAAETLRARGGDAPVVALGGAKWPGTFAMGAEFGGGARSATRQFPPWRGAGRSAGYFLWPTVRNLHGYITDAYLDALDDALAKAERST